MSARPDRRGTFIQVAILTYAGTARQVGTVLVHPQGKDTFTYYFAPG